MFSLQLCNFVRQPSNFCFRFQGLFAIFEAPGNRGFTGQGTWIQQVSPFLTLSMKFTRLTPFKDTYFGVLPECPPGRSTLLEQS